MMKRLTLFAVLLGLCCSLSGGESFGRSLYWQNMNVDATLTDEGRLLVREEQTMVFSGDWNGGEREFFIAPGQTFSFAGISRLTESGELLPLHQGSLKKVDDWNWASANKLRWRSRLPDDPPFSETVITYVLEYRLGHILMLQEDGSLRINHSFAFPDRTGEIQNFRLTLHFSGQWQNSQSPVIIEEQHLAPGRSVFYTANLTHSNPGAVEIYEKPLVPVSVAGRTPAPGWLTWSGGVLLLALLFYSSFTFYLHEIRLQRFVKGPRQEEIDEQWLAGNVFSLPPEIVGATWDKTTDSHEVAAILARLVAEGKMTSRLEEPRLPLLGWKIPGAAILHLELRQPRNRFKDYERALIDGFFIDGDVTDTRKIRQHYRKLGKAFRPAGKISYPLGRQVKKLMGATKKEDQSKWFYVVIAALAGMIIFLVNGVVHQLEIPFSIVGCVFGVIASIIGGVISYNYKSRADRLIGRSVLVHIFPLLGLVVYAGLGLLGVSSLLVLGLLLFYSQQIIGLFILARTTDSPEGVAIRRELAGGREYLRNQLKRSEPSIKDDWFPYLLAFGLGPDVDKWTKQFGDPALFHPPGSTLHTSSSSGDNRFTGGGGRFGGAGASGAWAAAATAMGTGASSSSSGSSGGGGSSSGGGGGGGW
jgi:uncharacterized membrane protein YgcG